ncbi:MAG: hypothetical protein ACREGH_01015 [Minisyncoccia bacterium]
MSSIVSLAPLIGFAIVIVVVLVVLVALEIYNSRRVSKLAYPAYEYALKRAEDEANRIVEKAREEARQVLENAEKEGATIATKRNEEGEAAQKVYQDALQTMLSRLEAELKESTRAAADAQEKMATAFLAELQAQGASAREHLLRLYDDLEKENAKRVDEQVAAAFDSARREAETYARARKEAIDAHILALVGDTVKIVLKKDLPETLQAELVREALEEAKASNVF